MKIAIVSDIHANLAALQAVLADIDAVAPGAAIWHTGDIVGYNAEPNEVVALLRERGAVGVMGNHDAAALGELDVKWFNPAAAAAVKWTATHLTPESASWLHALPKISEMGAATLVHGSPREPLGEYVIDAEGARENLLSLSLHRCSFTAIPTFRRTGHSAVVSRQRWRLTVARNRSSHHLSSMSAPLGSRATATCAQAGCCGIAATTVRRLAHSAPCSGDALPTTLHEHRGWFARQGCQSSSLLVSAKGTDRGRATLVTV